MIKTVLKFALLGALAYVLYKGAWIYSGVKWSIYVADCSGELQMCSLGRQKAPDHRIAGAVDALYACVEKRQPAVESIFVRVPKSHAEISTDHLDYKYAEKFCRDGS